MHNFINKYTSPGIEVNPVNPTLFKSCFIWQYEIMPKTSGFYIIYSRKNIPLYVGESNNLNTRLKEHNKGRTQGEYRGIKKERALHLQNKQTENKDYAELKKYFYRVEYFECNALDRRIYELFYMLKFETPFNKKPNMYCEFNNMDSFNYAKQYLENNLEELVCSVDGDNVDILYFIEEEAEDLKADPVHVILWRIYNANFFVELSFETFLKDLPQKTKELEIDHIDGEPLEIFLRRFIMNPAEPKLTRLLHSHNLGNFLDT